MKKYYKIKVGIEEFEVKEEDIPRIAEAMRTNNMVQLVCGLFRGSSILAVCRDEKKELSSDSDVIKEKTPEQIATIKRLKEIDEVIKQQIFDCKICEGKGWITTKKGDEYFATNCKCTKLIEEKQPEIKRISEELVSTFKL